MEDARGDWDAPGLYAPQVKTARKRSKQRGAGTCFLLPSKPMLCWAWVNHREIGISQIC